MAKPDTTAAMAPIIAALLAWCPTGLAAEHQSQDSGTGAKHANGIALAEIGREANRFDRNAALYTFVADVDPGRMEELLAEAAQLGDTPHGRDALRVLYIRYASLDPAAAASRAVRSLVEPRILSAVFRAWAHADLDSAVERAATIPPGARADVARAILQLDLPPEQLKAVADRLGVRTAIAEISKPEVVAAGETHDEAFAKLGAMDRDARFEQRALLSAAWAATDPGGALEAIVDWDGAAELKDSMLGDVMQKWARADVRAAMDWLMARDASDLQVLVFPAFEALAGVDLAEAESLVAALPTVSARRQAQLGVFTAIMSQDDLDRAQTAFTELDAQGQLWAISSFGRRLARADPEQAFEWLMGLGDAVRRMTFDWTMTAIHGEDPVLSKQLIQRVEDPKLRTEAARVVIRRGMTDPAASLRWAESLGTERDYAPVVGDVFQEWFRHDAARASAALVRYPRGPARDHALDRIVGVHLAAFDVEAAQRVFDTIDSANQRRAAAQRLHRYYSEVDRDERKAGEFETLAAEGG